MNDDSVIKINNETIEKVDRIEYLGFFVDKHLKFKEHIDYRYMQKKIGFLKRITNKISIITAQSVYIIQ